MKKLIATFGMALLLTQVKAVPFKLINTGIKSIYLEIPGVMNPNLSPFSSSGVGLETGQKIYFNWKGQREILLVVDDSLRDQKVNVRRLIRDRKKALKSEK